MANQLSKEELIILSEDVFESNPDVKVLIATSDGNFFLTKHKQEAKQHAQKHGLETFTIIADQEATLADLAEAPIEVPGDYTGLSSEDLYYEVEKLLALFAESRDPHWAVKICDMLVYGQSLITSGQAAKDNTPAITTEPATAGEDQVASGEPATPANEPAAPEVASGSPEAQPGEPAAPETPAAGEEPAAPEAPAATDPASKPSTRKKSEPKEA